MALELRQQVKLTQQLVMTPQLQQAIKLLQLNQLELKETIKQEMESNPVLEESNEGNLDVGDVDLEAQEINSQQGDIDEIDFSEEASFKVAYENLAGQQDFREYGEVETKEPLSIESINAKPFNLYDHLMWQVHVSNFDKREEEIALYIVGNINKDGYLDISIEDIAKDMDVSIELVERVLSKIQEFDPTGVGARDLRECLSIQARYYGYDEQSIVFKIIQDHLHDIERNAYEEIAKTLGVPIDEALAAIEVIKNFDPKPGRVYSDEVPQYIEPDIYVYKVGDEFVVTLNDEWIPRLRINAFYREVLEHPEKFPQSTREYIKKKLKSAIWLIKSIHQRQSTIYKVTKSIVKFQKEFLEKGIEYLRPLILRDVAEDVGLHESTISRVTTNKYVHTPQGTFELKFFFNSSIGRSDGRYVASETVKEKIRQIINAEDPLKPLSDQAIVEKLKEDGIEIARRTVAKYREAMGIPSSSKRKKRQ